MSQVFRALADPTRRHILELLRDRDMSAGELAAQFPLAKATLSRHFSVLREAELIHGDRRGTSIVYQLNVSVLEEALLEFMSRLSIDRPDQQESEDD
ncbi:MAG: autorepressor SdpR family transcription factor [Pseudomonadota bacterium]